MPTKPPHAPTRRRVFLLGAALAAAHVLAAPPTPETLWPEGAPGARGSAPADRPTITLHRPAPDRANGTAVVICPGGGYGGLMTSYEGHDVARWLNGFGVAGIVLQYRVSPYRHPAPLQDAQRALRIVRARAAEWGIDPNRIGLMGFSAGGHLAATVGTRAEDADPAARDPLDRISARPDFLVLIYPVITMGPLGHAGSRANLLGPNPDPALIDALSAERHVTPRTPPTFLAHSLADQVVPAAHSAAFTAACRSNQVPVAYVELTRGAHGLGAGRGPDWAAWQTNCAAWLEARGLLRAVTGAPGGSAGSDTPRTTRH